MNYFMGSGIEVDVENGYFSKKGSTLKAGDNIRMNNDRWRVVGHLYPRPLTKEEIQVGQEYDILFPREEKIGAYRLVEFDPTHFDFAGFVACQDNPGLPAILQGPFNQFQVFSKGRARLEPLGISIQQINGETEQNMIEYEVAKNKSFQLDVYDSHVLIAAG